ncbi:DNA-binding SARP family transcriptional activator [Asanoa ferruginea]|uniref:DNA-binding SARP family transcriptional activator n=1 Tax=Asanoa ferruginea TaxID=53367 RepID=A0A3D9ZJX8_9ACTN|nr:BTAD domain-containing putative transcriptional regulator [Asanoa ferruginea]REF97678.1 DNA-binding SARP family transcriptional activator [Asanoa ferruginea]GIF52411.1 SARP family transcriptional regulator [Asanoa ferruginea]
MRFEVLGPLRVLRAEPDARTQHADPEVVALAARQVRVVLANLLVDANRTVSVAVLAEALWEKGAGEETRRGAIRVLIHHLRKALGDDALHRTPAGYELVVPPGGLDSDTFQTLLAQAGRLRADSEGEDARRALRKALGLWRGAAAYDGDDYGDRVRAEAARLHELRLAAYEDCFELELELGRHREIGAEVRTLAEQHPLRERLQGQLMRALARSDRRAEALAAYERTRRLLADELGVDPGDNLRELHRRILRAAAQERTAPAQLPPPTRTFLGRDQALRRLDTVVGGAGGAPVAVVISGMAGVGKTTLAVQWGHRVRRRFPDGQLAVDLRGWAQSRSLRPAEVVGRFLAAFGVPAASTPADLDEAVQVYRTITADKQLLVLLDNAEHADQVRPLLPAGDGSVTLVTSRNRLAGLVAVDGAVALPLDVLAPATSSALLGRLLGADVVAREQAAAADLAALTGHLPLALRIAAAQVDTGRPRPITTYNQRLRAGDRLAGLGIEHDAAATVSAAFDLSYAALAEPARRLFRLLALVPGAEFGAGLATALTGRPEIGPALDPLVAASLVNERGPGRYGLHDLVAEYARGRLAADEPDHDAARGRLFGWYLDHVDAASRLVYPEFSRLPVTAPATPSVAFPSAADAVDWITAELPNLVPTVAVAAQHGPRPVAVRLADALRPLLWSTGSPTEWRAIAEAALVAAAADNDPMGTAAAEISLGDLHAQRSDLPAAEPHYRRALELARSSGWQAGEGGVMGNLALLYWRNGRLLDAIELFEGSIEVAQRNENRTAEATVLGNLSGLYWALGRLDESAKVLQRGLRLHRAAGWPQSSAIAFLGLGLIRSEQGRYKQARRALTRALRMATRNGNRRTEGDVLCAIAQVHAACGEGEEAIRTARRAIEIGIETERSRLLADAHKALGMAYHGNDDLDQAADALDEAIRLARRAAYPHTEVGALAALADLRREQGRPTDGQDLAETALDLARQSGFRILEGQALRVLASCAHDLGVAPDAIRNVRSALKIHRESGHRPGIAAALLLLGDVLVEWGDVEAGTEMWVKARNLYTDLASPHAAAAQARLTRA